MGERQCGTLLDMRPPICVRTLSEAERQALEQGLRANDAYVLRRCQMLLASARGERAPRIATYRGIDDQTVLDALHAVNSSGLACLQKKSSEVLARPPHPLSLQPGAGRALTRPLASPPARLRAPYERVDAGPRRPGERRRGHRLHPRQRGDHPPDAAAPGHWLEAGQALDHQPRSGICPKKGQRDRLIAIAEQRGDWGLGFADETWWSRFARPHLHTWVDATEGRRGRCGWLSRKRTRMSPILKPWPVTGCCCGKRGSRSGAGCALSMGGQCAPSRNSSWAGAATCCSAQGCGCGS